MQKIMIVGNLGADAELRSEAGQAYITMSVGVSRKVRRGDVVEEQTDWVSASYNGSHERLLPYLRKGTKVALYGDCSTRLYSSKIDRRMKAGLNMYVRDLELVQTSAPSFPKTVFDADGVAMEVRVMANVPGAEALQFVFDARGRQIPCRNGWLEMPDSSNTSVASGSADAVGDADGPAELDMPGDNQGAPF